MHFECKIARSLFAYSFLVAFLREEVRVVVSPVVPAARRFGAAFVALALDALPSFAVLDALLEEGDAFLRLRGDAAISGGVVAVFAVSA